MTKEAISKLEGGNTVYYLTPLAGVKVEGTVRYQDGIHLMVDFPNGTSSQWILENCPEEIPELSFSAE